MPRHNNYAKSSIKYLQCTVLGTWLKFVIVSPLCRWEMKLRDVKWHAQKYGARKWGARIQTQVSLMPMSIHFIQLFIPEGVKFKLLSSAFRTLCDGVSNFFQLLLTFIHPTLLLEYCRSLHILFVFCSFICSHSCHTLCLCYPTQPSLEV